MLKVPSHRFIQAYVHGGKIGVLVEFGLETRLITNNPQFLDLSRDIAMHIVGASPDSVEALLAQLHVRDEALTVGAMLAAAARTLGEEITVTRFIRWDHEPEPVEANPTPPRTPAIIMRMKKAGT